MQSEGRTEAMRLESLRDRAEGRSSRALEEVRLNGAASPRHPGNLNLSFGYVDGARLLLDLSEAVSVSSGSACSSAEAGPSYVLEAMGVPKDWSAASVRFGLGRHTTAEEVRAVADAVVEAVGRLRERSPHYGREGRAASPSIGERAATLAQPGLPPYIEQMSEAKGITLTPRAVEMAKQKVADQEVPVEGLRLGRQRRRLLRLLLRLRFRHERSAPTKTSCSTSTASRSSSTIAASSFCRRGARLGAEPDELRLQVEEPERHRRLRLRRVVRSRLEAVFGRHGDRIRQVRVGLQVLRRALIGTGKRLWTVELDRAAAEIERGLRALPPLHTDRESGARWVRADLRFGRGLPGS